MTLLELLGLLRKHLALLIILPVICALATAAYAWGFMANTYTASTTLYILTKTNPTSETISNTELTASTQITKDMVTLVKSDRIKEAAASELGVSSLSGYTIAATNSTDTRIITLEVTGADPQIAANTANKIAEVVNETAQSVMNVQSVNVIDYATAPTSPSGPKRLMYTGVAFLAGLFVAIAIIVLLDMLNVRVRKDEDVIELTDLTIIGRIPALKDKR